MAAHFALLIIIGSAMMVDGFPQNNNAGVATNDQEEPTTRIPPGDPTNAIVFSVPCACPHTFQYNPVCGSDGQTYGNQGILQCNQQCGRNVRLYLAAACGRNNG